MRRLPWLVAVAASSVACSWSQVQPQPQVNRESDFRAFLAQWEHAQSRFINGDPTSWKRNASHEEDVTIFGAFGGSEKGWKEVGPRNDWASSQFKESGAAQRIDYLNTGTSGDLAFTVAIERQQAQIQGQDKPTARTLRVTQVFRREGGVWKLLHRHADPLVDRLPPGARR
jgi:ketosteroid isomerase-like protein